MKKILLSLFFLSAALAVPAQQEFAPIGAVWHYTGRESFGPTETSLRVESVGDTVIMNRACRKLVGWFFFDSYQGPIFTHQHEGDTVWFFNPFIEDFEILYNFNAQPGYSWSHSKAYPETSEFFQEQYRVDSTSSVIINGQFLRRLHLSFRPENGSYIPIDDIIETLGSLHYLMYSFRFFAFPFFDATYPDGLRCYYDPEFGLYETGIASSCEAVRVREALAEPEGIRVFPNPAAGEVVVALPQGLAFAELAVYDTLGRPVLRRRVAHNEIVHLPERGLYYFAFFREAALLRSVKVFRQ